MRRAARSPLFILIWAALLWACDLSPQPLPPFGGNATFAPGGSSGSTAGGAASGSSTSGGPVADEADAAAAFDGSLLLSPGGDGGTPGPNGSQPPRAEGSPDAMSLDAEAGVQDADRGTLTDVVEGDAADIADAITHE